MPTDIVDTHSHLFPTAWRNLGRMPADMFDVSALLERQEAAGVATSIVSDPHIWYGDLDPGEITRSREYNDFVASVAGRHPESIVGLATVTPWRGNEHLAEAERGIRQLGLPGVAIPTSDRGSYLDSVPDDFWALAVELGVPVFLHPGGTVIGHELMTEYRMGEVCGRPLDTTVTLARFILTGGMERHPDLRLLCAHAGGAIVTVADRLDFGHELRDYRPLGPWGDVMLPRPPSAYVERLYLDTVTYGTTALRPAVDRVGTGQVVYGSDNPPVPFPLKRTIDIVRDLRLDELSEAAILGGNARAIFAI